MTTEQQIAADLLRADVAGSRQYLYQFSEATIDKMVDRAVHAAKRVVELTKPKRGRPAKETPSGE